MTDLDPAGLEAAAMEAERLASLSAAAAEAEREGVEDHANWLARKIVAAYLSVQEQPDERDEQEVEIVTKKLIEWGFPQKRRERAKELLAALAVRDTEQQEQEAREEWDVLLREDGKIETLGITKPTPRNLGVIRVREVDPLILRPSGEQEVAEADESVPNKIALTEAEFRALLTYTYSRPTSPPVGFRFKTNNSNLGSPASPNMTTERWWLGEVFDDPEPGYTQTRYTRIVLAAPLPSGLERKA